MRYQVLATDYDGTIATHGVVDDDTVGALERLRKSGRRIVLVTGRELEDLLKVFPHSELFDRIVAENGAIVYNPSDRSITQLGDPPPAALVDALRARTLRIPEAARRKRRGGAGRRSPSPGRV